MYRSIRGANYRISISTLEKSKTIKDKGWSAYSALINAKVLSWDRYTRVKDESVIMNENRQQVCIIKFNLI